MATFEEQVNGLTNLSISGTSTDPGTTELSTFLKDGVIDVTSRCLAVRPQDADDFVIESTESSSQGGLSTDGGKILHVMRESGTNDDWRECRKIPIGLKDRVTDTTSLHYASAYNPAYILSQYGAVLVFPAPSGSSGQYRIYYINKTPVDNVSGAALAYNASTIRYFPDDKVYLVVLYASIQSLQAALSAKSLPSDVTPPVAPASISLTTVSTSLPTFSTPSSFLPPASLSDVNVSFDEVGTFPSFVKPSFTATAPTYTSPVASIDISQLETFIETEEDVELAQSQIGRVQSELNKYQSDIQDNLNKFNKENAEYQALLKKHGDDIQAETQRVQNESQNYQQKVGKALQTYQAETGYDVSKLNSSLQKEVQRFTQDLAKENTKFQSGLNKYQAESGKASQDNQSKVAKFNADVQTFTTEYSNKIQDFSAKVQKAMADYSWMENRHKTLEARYNNAFVAMAGKQQPQPAQPSPQPRQQRQQQYRR